jgi:hypothetical protein
VQISFLTGEMMQRLKKIPVLRICSGRQNLFSILFKNNV